MLDWVWRLSRAVAGEPAASREVIRALKNARDRNTDVVISVMSGDSSGFEATGRVTALERQGIRIRQVRPADATETIPLSTQVRLRLTTHYGRLVGRCRVLSCETVRSPAGLPTLEYVLSAPESLDAFDRRASSRGTLGGPVIIEGELRQTNDDVAEPVRGLIGALTPTSAVLKSRNASGRVAIGQRMLFKGLLPPPVHEIAEMAVVTRVDGGNGALSIHIEFESELRIIAEAIHDQAESRRSVA